MAVLKIKLNCPLTGQSGDNYNFIVTKSIVLADDMAAERTLVCDGPHPRCAPQPMVTVSKIE